MTDFPTDDVTLEMLSTALHPGDHSERSSLYDFLELMSEMDYGIPTSVDEDGVTLLDRARWSAHDVIAALIGEVQRLRKGPE